MEANGIFLACAKVWVVFIEKSLDLAFLTELSSNVVGSGEELPNVDETTDGSASDGIHSLLHVNSHTISHENNKDILNRRKR